MARSGLYKSDIQKARDSLRAQGKHPSVDAVRVALGDTGSKTTIHRYLKELEAEESQGVGAQVAVSDALQDLIGRIAERLHAEADARIGEAKERFEAQLREHNETLKHQQQEIAGLSTQLQRTEVALQAETTGHAETTQTLAASTITTKQLEERITGLTTRMAEHAAHAQSLEQKHQHAREALEHFRTSAKEQRDQEQRRHEHQVQGLQVELRQAGESLTAKNHELIQLSRDNGRLTEQLGQLQKDLAHSQSDGRQAQHELEELRPLRQELLGLQKRWKQEMQAADQLRHELAERQADVVREREARQRAETDFTRAQARSDALDAMLAKLQVGTPPAAAEVALKASRSAKGSAEGRKKS